MNVGVFPCAMLEAQKSCNWVQRPFTENKNYCSLLHVRCEFQEFKLRDKLGLSKISSTNRLEHTLTRGQANRSLGTRTRAPKTNKVPMYSTTRSELSWHVRECAAHHACVYIQCTGRSQLLLRLDTLFAMWSLGVWSTQLSHLVSVNSVILYSYALTG